MKFRLVRPIVAPPRHKRKLLAALAALALQQKLGLKHRLKRMIKNTRHLSRRRPQPIQHRDIIQKRNHRRDQ